MKTRSELEAEQARLSHEAGLLMAKLGAVTRTLTEARCLAWLEWWEAGERTQPRYDEMRAGIEGGQWPEEQGND